MAKKSVRIPVRPLPENFNKGIAVGKLSSAYADTFKEAEHWHRHDFHFFIMQHKGESQIEVDFQKYQLKKSSVIYIHPSQVHRVTKARNAGFNVLAITSENIDPRYLHLLEEIAPANPLTLKATDFSLIIQAVELSGNVFERKDDKFYSPVLKDACNTIIGLIISKYFERHETSTALSRFEIVTKEFRKALEVYYIKYKRPADYANVLNISVPYLNECVKTVTGLPVSHHIQQRVILEAKRMLYHSDKSVKETAAELGFEDYPYFSRLFTKVTGTTALAFRNKNLD